MPVPKIPTGFDQLSTAEKIEYVQRLWERIAEAPEAVELTDAQRAELDRRVDAHRRSPDETVSWEDVKKKLRGKG